MSGNLIGNPILAWAAAVVLAGLTAWAANRWAIPPLGWRGVVLLSPAVEEAAKTFWALALAGGPMVILVHVGFGLVEGVKDMVARRPVGRQGRGAIAAPWTPVFAAAGSHSVFGAVTAVVASIVAGGVARGSGAAAAVALGVGKWWPWAAGAAAAFALHAAWNLLMVRAGAPGGRAPVGRG